MNLKSKRFKGNNTLEKVLDKKATISSGEKGENVVLIQKALMDFGFSLPKYGADGDYGKETESAVKEFQKQVRLAFIDGVISSDTMWYLDKYAETYEKNQKKADGYPKPVPPIIQRILDEGYDIMWEGDYHLNLYGVRTKSRQANSFDDFIGVAYTENGRWIVKQWKATTDPGTYWLKNPEKIAGTAILVPGQYKDVWKIDYHKGKYLALCQRNGNVKVYRDNNRDHILDMDPDSQQEGSFGINIHASNRQKGKSSPVVEKWSAGCQVHGTADGFSEMMELANLQVNKLGRTTFTYTLLED